MSFTVLRENETDSKACIFGAYFSRERHNSSVFPGGIFRTSGLIPATGACYWCGKPNGELRACPSDIWRMAPIYYICKSEKKDEKDDEKKTDASETVMAKIDRMSGATFVLDKTKICSKALSPAFMTRAGNEYSGDYYTSSSLQGLSATIRRTSGAHHLTKIIGITLESPASTSEFGFVPLLPGKTTEKKIASVSVKWFDDMDRNSDSNGDFSSPDFLIYGLMQGTGYKTIHFDDLMKENPHLPKLVINCLFSRD